MEQRMKEDERDKERGRMRGICDERYEDREENLSQSLGKRLIQDKRGRYDGEQAEGDDRPKEEKEVRCC